MLSVSLYHQDNSTEVINKDVCYIHYFIYKLSISNGVGQTTVFWNLKLLSFMLFIKVKHIGV